MIMPNIFKTINSTLHKHDKSQAKNKQIKLKANSNFVDNFSKFIIIYFEFILYK